MRQQLRFCAAPDGTRLAYAVSGQGSPVVKAGHWMTHLEHDWASPVWLHWLEDLSGRGSLVRYDERGCGLSDRDCPSVSLDDWVGDLAAVVDAAGVDRFTLVGLCQGGPVAVAYAAAHPERVERLVLYGTYVRGKRRREDVPQQREADALVAATRAGWGKENPAYRRLFTGLLIPGASEEQMTWLDRLQRESCSPTHAERARQVKYELDLSDLAATLSVPTLVLHARRDALVPFDEARHTASCIPGAQLVPLDSDNHIVLEDEAAWGHVMRELDDFLPPAPAPAGGTIDHLSTRERQVLALVSRGFDNERISQELYISTRTVERHLSNVYAKLGVSGKAARAAAAARFALLSATPGHGGS